MPDASRAKFLYRLFIVLFATSFVAAAVWSWSIVGSVRAQAANTDARLRELAWAVLAYADRHDAFPVNEAEFRAFVGNPPTLPEALAKKPLAIEGRTYPMTRAEAGASETPMPLDEMFASIEVEWPIERDVQPILRSRGLPTMQGTAPQIGTWLFAMTERIRAQ